MQIDVSVPDGKSGDWEVSSFEVTKSGADLHNMRAAFRPGGRSIWPGTYKQLTRNGQIIMSNTPAEISDILTFVFRAKHYGGQILINGLGLGVALAGVLAYENVEHVDVVELSQDVLKLVAPTFEDDRVTFNHANAYGWKPPKGKRYSAVWHDIWDNICADNLPEMTRLHRKYGRRCEWQGSWCKELCRRYR